MWSAGDLEIAGCLQPVSGKKSGEMTEFDSQCLFNTKLH
jgi:hypothetical protein